MLVKYLWPSLKLTEDPGPFRNSLERRRLQAYYMAHNIYLATVNVKACDLPPVIVLPFMLDLCTI